LCESWCRLTCALWVSDLSVKWLSIRGHFGIGTQWRSVLFDLPCACGTEGVALPHYVPQRGKDRDIDLDTTYVMFVLFRRVLPFFH
jgi:hypothetical protein